MGETTGLISELHERAAYYFDRPSVPVGEYTTAREVSTTEARAISDLLRRAAVALELQA